MNWTYSLKNRITAAILLAVIVGLTMLTNLMQRKRFEQLEQSFTSIYEDRLLAESYLFHLYVDLKKEQDVLRLVSDQGMSYSSRKELDHDRADREQLLAKYEETYLTPEEGKAFNKLKVVLEKINDLEKQIEENRGAEKIPGDLILKQQEATDHAFALISDLSDIQTAEGALLRKKSKQIILGSVSISQFEMSILIIIAIVIQALVFSSKTLLGTKNQDPSLN